MKPVRLQRSETSFLPTQSQFLIIYSPFFINLNLKSDGGSTQIEQVPQVEGHDSDTPVLAQRVEVFVRAAHWHERVTFFPPDNSNLILRTESSQLYDVGEMVGANVDRITGLAVGLGVAPITGLSIGLVVGLAVGLDVGFDVGLDVGAEVIPIVMSNVMVEPAALMFDIVIFVSRTTPP